MQERNLETHAAKPRRTFLGLISSILMATGLAGGYGYFASIAVRFLYPNGRNKAKWQFVGNLDQIRMGESLPFQTPSGSKIVVARQSECDSAEDFIALSSVCPHLGCAVHWESQNDRFFCPCHNGAFDASGKPTEGPPAAANQSLTRFPLMVENGLLFIEISSESISSQQKA